MNVYRSGAFALVLLAGISGSAQAASLFGLGNLVVAIEGDGAGDGITYADNAAAPLTLQAYSTTGTKLNKLVLPQTSSGKNFAISGEYGSSSEGFLQLTADGRYLTIAGYGVNAAAYNTAVNDPAHYGADPYGNHTTGSKFTALAQSGSLTGQNYTAVARVIALVGSNGVSDTSTGLFNVFNGNNPRSVASADGSSFYVSGQGKDGDHTSGVFFTNLGSSAARTITGDDTGTDDGTKVNNHALSQDTRDVQIVTHANGSKEVLVSTDTKGGKNGARSYVGSLGSLATDPGLYSPTTGLTSDSANGPTMLAGFGNSGGTGKVSVTTTTGNPFSAGKEINLSPEQFFYASDSVLYVADSGMPNNDSADKKTGNGGLQKWMLINNIWQLQYTVTAGLNNFVKNDSASGTTGLFGLTGQVVGGQVFLYATNYTIGDIHVGNDLNQTYLYSLTDTLTSQTKGGNEAFVTLATAADGTKFRGVSFAPSAELALPAAVPEPASWAMMLAGFGVMGGALRRARRDQGRVAAA